MATSRAAAKDATSDAPAGTPAPLETDANPTGDPAANTGPVGTPEVIDAQEHVLGDDPRRVQAQTEGGFHDSLTGAPVDGDGNFLDEGHQGIGPVPKHRIVANNWPQERDKIDDASERSHTA